VFKSASLYPFYVNACLKSYFSALRLFVSYIGLALLVCYFAVKWVAACPIIIHIEHGLFHEMALINLWHKLIFILNFTSNLPILYDVV
jgi:hypothetical protein